MRRSRSPLLASCVLSGLLAAAPAAAEEPGPAVSAARVEGYMGAAILDGSGFDSEAEIDAGGAGSVSVLLGPAYFQADVFGDYTDFHPDARNVGFGAHLGVADPELYAVGASFAYQEVEWDPFEGDFLRGGGEAELFLGPVTLGVLAGYLEETNSEENGFYARALVRWYVTPDVKLEGVGGVADVGSDTSPQARFLVEFRPQGWPVGFFTRWEGAFDSSLDQHFAVLGIRLYLEGFGLDSPRSLRSTDRIYFREACQGFLLGARAC